MRSLMEAYRVGGTSTRHSRGKRRREPLTPPRSILPFQLLIPIFNETLINMISDKSFIESSNSTRPTCSHHRHIPRGNHGGDGEGNHGDGEGNRLYRLVIL